MTNTKNSAVNKLRQLYEILRVCYAEKPNFTWWQEYEPMEIILGAVLFPGSYRERVDEVLDAFRSKKLLDCNKIINLTDDELATLIRPVGLQKKKAERIRSIIQLVTERSDGDLDRFFARPTEEIFKEVKLINGLGPITVGTIMLYVKKAPVYEVDLYTARILKHH